MPALRFVYAPSDAGVAGAPDDVVFVDGTTDGYRSLSHWPGNTTPAPLKHDLSTGIALEFARATPARRAELLGPISVVANNHYDTDGALSVFAVMRPDEALPRAELMLRAAATGDFATWNGPDALAVELTVMSLLKHPASPLAATLKGATDAERKARGYAWLIEELPAILDDPFRFAALWAGRLARVEADVAAVQAGRGVSVQRHPLADLAVVHADRPLTAIGLHLAAGPLYRVLLVRSAPDGHRYRLILRDESWFELVTVRAAPRRPLEPLAAALDDLEAQAGGGSGSPGRWWHTSVTIPVAELGFGVPAESDAFFEDLDLSADLPSRLPPDQVVATLRAAFAGPG